jgi:hypothetical protein
VSTGQAIEAVTLAVRNLLSTVTANVTIRPLDRARNGQAQRQLNLFLYEVVQNGALRNFEPPTQPAGAAGLRSPLALTLRYLLTAYTDDENLPGDHTLLGHAMKRLHDNPVLSPSRLEGVLPAAHVHLQFERVRLTPMDLSSEEVSKLWTAFQTSYRLSVAYEASVVLIDTESDVAPLPVLRRGRGPLDDLGRDEGALVGTGGLPTVEEAYVEAWRGNARVPARTGDRIVLVGEHLGGDIVDVLFRHERLGPADPVVESPAAGSTAERLVVDLPASLPPGPVTLTVRCRRGTDPAVTSNALAIAVATRIGAVTTADGEVRVDVDRIADDQAVVLLLGSRHAPALLPVRAGQPLRFAVGALPSPSRPYTVRVRVDGVDSVPLRDPDPDPSVPLPAEFDPAQQVVLP